MINQNNLHWLKAMIDINDDDIKSLKSIWPTDIKIWEYISHKYNCILSPENYNTHSSVDFCDAYQSVKDPTWPNISSIEGFYRLSDSIQSECRNVHNFAPDLWFDKNVNYESWTSAGITSYPLYDVIKAHYLINKNQDILLHKRILDFPSHFGQWAYWMGKLSPQHLTLADVRPALVSLAKEYMNLLPWAKHVTSVIEADFHNYAVNTELCRDFDTLIFAGALYHVHDHFQILKSFADSKIANIIIETTMTTSRGPMAQFDYPYMEWDEETTNLIGNGWFESQSSISVGYPNSKWIDQTMSQLGYHRTRNVDYFPDKFPAVRSVHVYQKKQ